MKVTIVSIAPYLGENGLGFWARRTYGNYIIPACPKGKKYEKLTISDTTEHYTIWTSQTDKVVADRMITGEAIAADIMAESNLAAEGGMICAGDEPTEKELQQCRENRQQWLRKAIGQGDAIFMKVGGKGIDQIPDFMKRAAEELEEHPAWTYRLAASREQCEGCGSDVMTLRDGSKPAVCAQCGAYLDMEKAIRLGLYRPPQQSMSMGNYTNTPAMEATVTVGGSIGGGAIGGSISGLKGRKQA